MGLRRLETIRRRTLGTATVVAVALSLLPAAPSQAQDYTLGIDASHHQGDIDWQRVVDSGHVFAFYKATEGATFTDDTYAPNRVEAADASIPFGAYHFARPQGDTIAAAEADAVSEAEHFLEVAQPEPGDLLPVLDLEATGGLGAHRLIAWTQRWLDEVEAALDVKALIYTSPNFWETNLDNTTTFAGQGFPLWLAHYTSQNSPRTPASNWGGEGWAFWQWTSEARVPGISGNVDENRYEGSDLSPYVIPGAPEPEPSPGDATPPSNDTPPEISGETEVGQKLTATTGSWSGSTPLSYSYAWHRCDEDGTGCTGILGGTEPDYRLQPEDYGHRLKVTVTATNSAGSSSEDSDTTDVVTDTAAPLAPRIIKPRRAQTLKTTLKVQWAFAEDLARYDVRYRRSASDGTLGAHSMLVEDEAGTTARVRARTGKTYCFSARATDEAGNRSGWSNERCTTVPLDDRQLRSSGGWTRSSDGTAFLETLSNGRRRGVRLAIEDVAVRELFLVAETCPSCGKVTVLFNGRAVGTVNLRSDSAQKRQVLRVGRLTALRRGDIELVVATNDQRISIDGLVPAVL